MDLSDEALIESFRNTKDASHFCSLVRRYQNRIYNAAFRILGNTEEAEEVVQETYIRVHHNLDKFRRQSSFGAWLFRIVHNLCVDALRARQKQKGFQLLSFDPQSTHDNEEIVEVPLSGVISQVADPGLCPEQEMDVSEQSLIIQSSLRELPEPQRVVIVLHDIEGFSYEEISEIVGTSIGTVRSRLHYGRLKLRQLLEPYFAAANLSPASR